MLEAIVTNTDLIFKVIDGNLGMEEEVENLNFRSSFS
jgi:seryl-tRNA(Sec) selenium transferase